MSDPHSQPVREQAKLQAPVRWIPDDQERRPPASGLALCLSGGGYRAMLFHLGALWRLNELGYLPRLTRVSSVSGGSITAAFLGLSWNQLRFAAPAQPSGGVATNFEGVVVRPIRGFAGRTLDVRAGLGGMLLPGATINGRLAAAYRRHLFGRATLQDLPADEEGPRFVINATNLQSGVLWRFSRPYAADYRVGLIAEPEIELADAVAASSAFPPVLAPARPRFEDGQYVPESGMDLQTPPFTTRPTLADGGVYDNLGLETAWKSCKTVLVSDGGGAMEADEGGLWKFSGWRWRDWGTQTARVLKVVDNQVRSLRKRQIIAGYRAAEGSDEKRLGAYWSIRSHTFDYPLDSSLPADEPLTEDLAGVPTRLKRLDALTQERLINWGYVICDTAMRTWVEKSAPVPDALPYPDRPLRVG